MTHKLIKTYNYLLVVSDKKIIYHLPLNNSPVLEGVDLLPPLEDEVEKLVKEHWEDDKELNNPSSFKAGYNKAKEKYKYTERDMITAITIARAYPNGEQMSDEQIMQSLQQPKYPVAFECETETPYTDGYADDRVRRFYGVPQPKTITNSQGQTQLVGTYIYE